MKTFINGLMVNFRDFKKFGLEFEVLIRDSL